MAVRSAAFNFAVNPVNGDQIVISSSAGRIFRTEDQGAILARSIGDPAVFDGTYAPALAFGAPDPNGPGGIGNLDNFLYAGTSAGHIYVTQTGGGAAAATPGSNISAGPRRLAAVQAIVTNPTRGSHEAYAVTHNGVYYIADSDPASGADLESTSPATCSTITHDPVRRRRPCRRRPSCGYLTSIQADWRYVIPDDPANPTGPAPTRCSTSAATAASSGRSTTARPGPPFPDAEPDSVDADPAGRRRRPAQRRRSPTSTCRSATSTRPPAGPSPQPGDPNVLLATTFGRGSFAIRLAPIVFPSTRRRSTPTCPRPAGSVSGTDSRPATPIVTVTQPVIDGLSEQTAFGNVVRITLLDLTDPTNPVVIGGYDPADPVDRRRRQPDRLDRPVPVQVNPNAFTRQRQSRRSASRRPTPRAPRATSPP